MISFKSYIPTEVYVEVVERLDMLRVESSSEAAAQNGLSDGRLPAKSRESR